MWNGGDAGGGDLEARRHRDRMFQLGLFTCLVMVLLDARTAPLPRAETAASDSPMTKRPYQQLKKVLAAQSGDGRAYPTNVTGKFTGNWTREVSGTIANATSGSEDPTAPKFKISSRKGRFAMQVSTARGVAGSAASAHSISVIGWARLKVFMDQLEGLEELSLVRGYFQLVGDSDSLRHQLTSSVQGIFFHKYGRVTMVTSDHLYLKGNKLPFTSPGALAQNTTTHNTGVPGFGNSTKSSTSGADLARSAAAALLRGRGSADADASTRQMLSSLSDSSTHRRLSAAIDRRAAAEAKALAQRPALLTERSQSAAGSGLFPNDIAIDSSPVSDDPRVFVFPVPGSSVPPSAASLDSSSRSTRRCQFQFDLKAGPSCELEACPKDGPQNWVTSLDGRIVSENCNVELRLTTKAFHIDWERVYPEATKYSVVVTVVCLLQIIFLFRQLHYTSTPALAARISLICIGHQSVLDAIICVIHLLLCAFLPQLFAAFASIAFFKLIIFIIVEMRYIVVISHGRDPQRFFSGGTNQLRQEFALLHLRFYGVLFVTLIAVYVLQAYFNYIVLLAYSYWVPQIVTNAVREVRQPFHRLYLFGMSATRLVIPLYVYGFPSNLVHIIAGEKFKSNYGMCFALVLWTAVQIWILLLQQKLGPQFMVPARFLPPKYDYRRPLSRALLDQAAEEGGHPECVICYQAMNVQPFASQDYMITPCDHIFHQQCLERWMQQKAECPVCRSILPPP